MGRSCVFLAMPAMAQVETVKTPSHRKPDSATQTWTLYISHSFLLKLFFYVLNLSHTKENWISLSFSRTFYSVFVAMRQRVNACVNLSALSQIRPPAAHGNKPIGLAYIKLIISSLSIKKWWLWLFFMALSKQFNRSLHLTIGLSKMQGHCAVSEFDRTYEKNNPWFSS